MEKTDKELLVELSSKVYKEQAIWFLNAYWDRDLNLGAKEEELERIWSWTHTCQELDNVKKEEGNELDEFQAHRLLEKVDKALTVKKMREIFQKIDLDFNKMVSLTEFLIYKYEIDYKVLIRAPQASGESMRLLEAAERMVAAAQESVEVCKEREEDSKQKLLAQKQAEQAVRNALDQIAEEERKLEAEKVEIESRANDENLGIVKRQKAVNELAQWKAQDNEAGIRRAKIDQEAAVRKQERASRAAAEAKAAAERARADSEAKFAEAQETLEELKSKAGAGQGRVWWMMRELEESKKYMSKKQRQKVEATQEKRKLELEQELGL